MHLSVAGDLINPKAPMSARLKALVRAGLHYAWWYPTRWIGWSLWPKHGEFGPLAKHVRYVERASRRLARATFHAMVRFGPGLEKRQAVLGRLVDIGAELFVMTAVVVRAEMLEQRGKEEKGMYALADAHCRRARRRIGERFRTIFNNDDKAMYAVARGFLEGELTWLEHGIVPLDEYREQLEAPVEPKRGTRERTEEPVTA
jgi:hypothetical protein